MRIIAAALAALISFTADVQAQTPCNWTAQTGSVVETCGKVGIMNPAPAKELDVIGHATISGTLTARELTLLPDSGARARLLAVLPGWIGLVSNSTYNGAGWVLDDATKPGWFARVSTPHDEFAVYRIPIGAGNHTDEKRLFAVQANGWVLMGPETALYAQAPLEIASSAGKTILVRDTTLALGAAATGMDFSTRVDLWGTHAIVGSLKTIKANDVNNDKAGRMTASVAAVDGTMTEVARFTAGAVTVTGNVHTTGNISADGVIYAKYQDVAEWVPATEDLAPGTVVVLNPLADNQVMPSSRPYDTTVAGVVSAQPGLILGEASPAKETVATTGRVRVRVDAGKGAIAVGDLLVTSDRAGYAMKSVPVELPGVSMHRPGTIIGKALQPLARGEGEILVLLSLQ